MKRKRSTRTRRKRKVSKKALIGMARSTKTPKQLREWAKKQIGKASYSRVTRVKKRRAKRSMARKKRTYRRVSRGFGSMKGIIRKVALGVGGGTLAVSLLRAFNLPVNIPDNLLRLGGAYYFGGIEGAIGSMLIGSNGINFGNLLGTQQQTTPETW